MSPGAVKQGLSVQRTCGSCLGEETKDLGELPWKKGIEDPREADAISFQCKSLQPSTTAGLVPDGKEAAAGRRLMTGGARANRCWLPGSPVVSAQTWLAFPGSQT